MSIPRGELAKIIYQKIECHCETIFGDSVKKIDQDEDRVRVHFEREPPRDFEMVIGADGLHSVVRKLVFGNDDRFEKYLGYMVAAFSVKAYRPKRQMRMSMSAIASPASKWRALRCVTTGRCFCSFSLIIKRADRSTRRILTPIRIPYGLNLAKLDGSVLTDSGGFGIPATNFTLIV